MKQRQKQKRKGTPKGRWVNRVPGKCIACNNRRLLLPLTDMCGVCTFGEASQELVTRDFITPMDSND